VKVIFTIIAVLVLIVGVGSYLVLTSGESPMPTISSSQSNARSNGEPSTPKAETVNVTYDNNGFEPKQITVAKGSSVNFANKTQMPMWIASAPHPEHTDYPELDAGLIEGDHIAPGNPSFSFKFDKPGTWSYHNHSVPEHQAVIVVK
jgi:plastocyanin